MILCRVRYYKYLLLHDTEFREHVLFSLSKNQENQGLMEAVLERRAHDLHQKCRFQLWCPNLDPGQGLHICIGSSMFNHCARHREYSSE
jgi:hypothetical protein